MAVAIKRGRMCYSSPPLQERGDEHENSVGARDVVGNDEEVGLLANECEGDRCEEVVVLQGVDLELKRGQFLIICGEIGAGKSTLLACLAMAQPLTDGEVQVRGSRAYASQKAFVMTGTIRDNVVFKLPFEPSKYRDALERAQLLPDLELLPMYDLTIVGPEGVQLSGGQRARVALARVIYADADVVLLDDVMSALDAETGRAVWANAICWMKARGKTVVLVTHQLQLLERPEVDLVALLHAGKLVAMLPYKDLAESGAGSSSELLSHLLQADDCQKSLQQLPGMDQVLPDPQDESATTSRAVNAVGRQGLHQRTGVVGDEDTSGLSLSTALRLVRTTLTQLQGRILDPGMIDKACDMIAGKATAQDSDERKAEGFITGADLALYLREFGTGLSMFLLFSVTISSAFLSVGANVFLSIWTDGNAHCSPAPASGKGDLSAVFQIVRVDATGFKVVGGDAVLGADDVQACNEAQQQRNLAFYAAFGAGAALLACSQALVLTPCALRASRRLHERLVDAILTAPMSFFDCTSAGSTLNRFLQDMANIDVFVPNATMNLAAKTLQILVRVGLVASMAPYSLLVVPLLMPAYNAIYQRVRVAARDTRRIEGVAHSPVYTFFGDMLRGRQVIRAFGVQPNFLSANEQLVRELSTATVGNQATCKWAQALTVQTGAFLYFGCGAVCVYLNSVGKMNTSQMGLVLLYAAELQRAGMEYMMTLTNVETQFVSVERVAAYIRLENEFESDERDRDLQPQRKVPGAHGCTRNGDTQRLRACQDKSSVETPHVEKVLVLTQESNGSCANGNGHGGGARRKPLTWSPARVISEQASALGGGLSFEADNMEGGGEIRIEGLSMRYSPHSKLVLRSLCLQVTAGSKVAVCGRTGCGKSSLFAALSRLYPLCKGAIFVDGVDICQVGLERARSTMVRTAPRRPHLRHLLHPLQGA